MNLSAAELTKQLKNPLKPLYIIYGDEPLLVQEAADNVRQAARQQGYSDREIYYPERGIAWDEIMASANNLSLFGDRKVIELRFTNKPDTSATAILEKYAADPAPDTLLLLLLPKLDKTQQKAKWFIACDKVGVSIDIPLVDNASFPDWLSSRLIQAGLSGDQETFQLLIERLEGNLLAAKQEIEKLRLLAHDGIVTAELVRQSVGDNARYNAFDLADAALRGDINKACRMLSGLQAEGESCSSILWVLAKEARALAALREGLDAGQPLSSIMQQNGIWQKRQGLFQQALKHMPSSHITLLTQESLAADRAIKGQSQESDWDVLLRLCLLIAGRPLFSELA